MKKRRIMVRVLGAFIAFVTAVSFLAPAVQAKPSYSFEFSMTAGINDELLVGYGAPFYVTVKNTSSTNVEGQIQLIIPNSGDNNAMFARDISIGQNETKTVLFNAGLSIPSPFVNVRIADKKGNVLGEELMVVNSAKDKKAIRVGVMTDDFTAVAYMDKQHLLADNELFTSVTEITKDSLTEYGQSLEMYDVIVISDYSTDLLTEAQIDALSSWTASGGLLIIGTGSTANKTLSGLKNSFIDVKLGDASTQSTSLGLANEDYSYVTDIINEVQNSNYYGYSYTYNSLYGDPELDDFYGMKYYMWYDPEYYSSTTFAYSYDSKGRLMDNYGNMISPDYYYLFEPDASYTDPLSGEFHYKYYDELYGEVDDYDASFQYFYNDAVNYDYLDDYCMQEYFNLLGYDANRLLYDQGYVDDDERREVFDDIWGADYEEFTRHHMYGAYNYEWYYTDVRTDIWTDFINNTTGNYDAMNVDFREIELSGSNDSLDIIGDTKSGDFTLGKVQNVGEGYVAVFGIDFTKNPIPKSPYSGEFFRNIIERLIGAELIIENNEYTDSVGYSYSYNNRWSSTSGERELFSLMSSAPIPPVLAYIIVLGLFLVFVLVIYFVLLKKKKTRKLWVVYPIASAAVLMIIFCFSFSTRLLRMNINTVSIIEPKGSVTSETLYVSAIAPKKKTYELNFSDSISLETLFDVSDSYYSSYSNIDYDKYTKIYVEGKDGMTSVVNSEIPLSSTEFKAKSFFLTQGGAEVTLAADPSIVTPNDASIRVNNNYSTDLEDVIVVYCSPTGNIRTFFFDKIKAGEAKLLLEGKEFDYFNSNYHNPYAYNNYYIGQVFNSFNSFNLVSSLLIGEVIPSNRTYIKRSLIVDDIMDDYELADGSVFVVGFPKGKIGSDIIDTKSVKTNKYEAVILYDKIEDLRVE